MPVGAGVGFLDHIHNFSAGAKTIGCPVVTVSTHSVIAISSFDNHRDALSSNMIPTPYLGIGDIGVL